MRILVVSHSGRPLAAPLMAEFDEHGGLIGRSPDCRLVLPDPERQISRQHARIDSTGSGFSITCLGSGNPIFVGGRELRAGQLLRLAQDDPIVIGDYEMRVDLAPTAGPLNVFDPFAEFDPPAAQGSPPAAQSGPPGASIAAWDRASSPDSSPDPFGRLSASESTGDEPVREASGAADGAAPGLGLLGTVGEGARSNDGIGLPAESIDDLFGLRELGPDPLKEGGPLADGPFSRADDAAAPGSLARLIGNPRVPPAQTPDRASELAAAVSLPEAIPPTSFGLGPAAERVPDVEPLADSSASADVPAPNDEAPWGAPTAPTTPTTATTAPTAPTAPTASTTSTEAPPPNARQPGADELLAALVDGLGLGAFPTGPFAGGQAAATLTPELMRRIGQLLRATSEGTVELLQARSTLKREMQAEVTFIAPSANNPLKFSPDGQAALAHLLSSTPVRGFMEPVPALRDAYDDLLAHQVGMAAGMRAAIRCLIERFDPAALESRLAGKSLLDALLPAVRDARLWGLFNEMFAEISREAEDDFENLFSREFAKAYDEQIALLGKRRG